MVPTGLCWFLLLLHVSGHAFNCTQDSVSPRTQGNDGCVVGMYHCPLMDGLSGNQENIPVSPSKVQGMLQIEKDSVHQRETPLAFPGVRDMSNVCCYSANAVVIIFWNTIPKLKKILNVALDVLLGPTGCKGI